VKLIIQEMKKEQFDHLYSNLNESYTKYRKVVAEWMIDVCSFFNLHETTSHAAIVYMDRLTPNEQFSRVEWQMIAVCCILISAKYNEKEDDIPDLASLEQITHQSLSNEAILNYELWALKRMGWKLNGEEIILL
jgi:hypothetical protein